MPAAKPKVILRFCDTYDSARIRRIMREGLEELGLRPFGRTLVKPNIVISGPQFPHTYTRAEFMEGLLLALQDRADGRLAELAVGERCGITMPTRLAYEGADYDPMLARVGVKRYCFEEEPQVEIPYTHPRRLRDYVFTPEPVARADFFVNAPKFKGHPWTTVTFSLKNYIGIQDDRHRLIDHDHKLNEKIADLQHIVQPQFIAIDAITAGESRMLTPIPYAMNLIVMGNNQVAFDAVCCHIIGLDARTVDHIRLAHEHGFGPIDLSEIEVTGDVPLAEAHERHKGFRKGLIRVEKYFEGSHITAYAGPPPREEGTGDYCWGGCPGAIEEAIEILRRMDARCDQKMARLHVVFGAYDGPIDAKPGEQVVFIGDCATWSGKIGGELVRIESLYRDRSTKDPHHAKHDDIYAKLASITAKWARERSAPHLRVQGCPVSVAELVLTLSAFGGVKNPFLEKTEIVRFNRNYVAWRAAMALKKVRGQPYQKSGPSPRGAAAPEEKA